MKNVILSVTIITSMLVFNDAQSQTNNFKNKKMEQTKTTEKTAIEKLIFTYQDALNASDTEKVITLYTKNGSLIANAAPTADGIDAVKELINMCLITSPIHLNFLSLKLK